MIRKTFRAALLAASIGAACAAWAGPLGSGIDRSGMDPAVRPQDDLFLAMNGGWIRKTEIPADKAIWGIGTQLRDRSDQQVRELVEELAAKPQAAGSNAQKVADFHRAWIDVGAIDKAGLAPVMPSLRAVDALRDKRELAALMGRWQGLVNLPVGVGVNPDFKRPDVYAAAYAQGGLGLPDRDYYLKDDARFAEARADATARVRDALFFQLAADGWREKVVTLSVNLPNGTSVFHRAVPVPAMAPSDYAEELMLDAVASVSASGSSNDLHRCAGIVSDRFKSKALRDLENKNYWMVNLCCQIHSFTRLVRDFARELSLFRSATAKSAKLAAYFNAKQTVRSLLHKHQIQELGHASLLRVAHVPFNGNGSNCRAAFEMLEDILNSAHPLHRAVQEDSYKLVCIDDSVAREIGEMVHSEAFWIEVDAVHSLVKLVMDMVKEMEADRPLVGQCLPLWEELRSKVRDWCEKFNIDEGTVLNVLEKRFRKNYHPAWSAAFILDPLYLVKDASGRYLPPFKCLTPDQEKDVDRLITRMVSREEAHLVLMELMKWRSDGLDPLYAQAVQVRQPDPSTGRMKVANKQSSRLVWETCLSELKSLGKVAVRLIFLHATSRGFRCTPSMVRWLSAPGSLASGNDRAHRLVFVAANSKLERRDFSSDEDKDAELLAEGDDDVANLPGNVES